MLNKSGFDRRSESHKSGFDRVIAESIINLQVNPNLAVVCDVPDDRQERLLLFARWSDSSKVWN